MNMQTTAVNDARHWQQQASVELFNLHFARWRVANLTAILLTLVTGVAFQHLTHSEAIWWWTAFTVGTYLHKAAWNMLYERRQFSFERWLWLSIVLKGICGIAAGSLVFFIPASERGLMIAAVMISGAFSLGEATACGNLRLMTTTVLSQATMTCIALLFYAHEPFGFVLGILFTGMVLHYGRVLTLSMQNTLVQRLYAEQLTTQLEKHQTQLLEAQHQQSVLHERQRVMQDMHDGLGSTLLSSLVLLQRNEMDVAHAANVMRECIEDLRLVIDSLEPTSKHLPTLLGMLRYRLQQKIEAGGVTLHWHMDDLPELPWLEPSLALNLLRLVQEAISNVLKHAQATTLTFEVAQRDDTIELTLQDNGRGFDLQQNASSGRGIRTMKTRAARLHGELRIDSSAGRGTRITLTLPLTTPAIATQISIK